MIYPIKQKFLYTSYLLLGVLFEYFALRLVLHQGLGLRIGWKFGSDFDFLLPMSVAHFVFLFHFFSDRGNLPKFNQAIAGLHVALVTCFIGASYLLFGRFSPTSWLYLLWSLFGIATLTSYYAVWLSTKRVLRAPFFLPSLFIALSAFLHYFLTDLSWKYLGTTIGYASKTVSEAFLQSKVTVDWLKGIPDGALLLWSNGFSVRINAGCSGGDANLLFLGACLLYRSIGKKKSWLSWLPFIGGSLSLLFLVNIFRISLLFSIGHWLQIATHPQRQLYLNLVHGHVGWLLYCPTIWLLFRIFSKEEDRFISPSSFTKAMKEQHHAV